MPMKSAAVGDMVPLWISELSPVLRACLTYGLSSPTQVPASPVEWSAALSSILGARMGAVAIAAATSAGLDLPPPIATALRDQAFDLTAFRLEVTTKSTNALYALQKDRIEFILFKGLAVSRFQKYSAHRPFSDLDLMVRPRSFRAAVRCLERLGYVASPEAIPPWGWFDRYCREGINLHSPTGGSIDLHHHGSPWTLGKSLDLDTILERSEFITIGDLTVPVPSPGHCLVLAALHVMNDLYKDDVSLLSWRDILSLFQKVTLEERLSVFRELGISELGVIIAECARRLSPEIAESVEQSTRRPVSRVLQQRRLAALGWAQPSFLSRHPLGWAARLPAPNAVAFLVGSLLPSPYFATEKHNGYVRYWAECATTLLQAARGVDFRARPLGVRARAASKRTI